MPPSSASAQEIDRVAADLLLCLPALHRAMDRRVSQDFPHPKPPEAQLALLWHVRAHEGVTVREVAEALMMKPNNVSALVSQLTRQGELERRQDTADKRIAHLYLTARARQRIAEVEQLMSVHLVDALQALTDGERRALGAAVGALHALTGHLRAAQG
ncbi:MarR family transcriptional regulator [Streptomyces sp. NPDC001652]|uniref:MarR family winged helix-turn-helix transcriptional regulator n=1 Tax=Streptomyces sp. NPDC001652 TaxID=3154393 RepID=UPI00331A59D1